MSLLLLAPVPARSEVASGADYELTRTLVGGSGVNQVRSAEHSTACAVGEDAAGGASAFSDWEEIGGYFGGRWGNASAFKLLSVQIGATRILREGYQIGVPLDANITLIFSTPLDPLSIQPNLTVYLNTDHLGQAQNVIEPTVFNYDVTGSTVILSPPLAWKGNTLYDLAIQPDLQSADGFALGSEARTPFITVLDPHQENRVLHPMAGTPSAGAGSNNPLAALDVHLPSEALSDFSVILFSQDPLNNPLQTDPRILQTANQKAQAAGGPYRTPLALSEISAYNLQGVPINNLQKPVDFSITFNNPTNNLPQLVRSKTLSLWALDQEHQLWVKLPDSRAGGASVTAPITQFSVYALMGGVDGNAAGVYVFPTPWRPHGPNAGSGTGQTGTDAGGMTFANLPSECDIHIYTLSGELVRQLHHSDAAGPIAREPWDGNTAGGSHAASGVYLWRVESSTDGKNGKLMIIR